MKRAVKQGKGCRWHIIAKTWTKIQTASNYFFDSSECETAVGMSTDTKVLCSTSYNATSAYLHVKMSSLFVWISFCKLHTHNDISMFETFTNFAEKTSPFQIKVAFNTQLCEIVSTHYQCGSRVVQTPT